MNRTRKYSSVAWVVVFILLIPAIVLMCYLSKDDKDTTETSMIEVKVDKIEEYVDPDGENQIDVVTHYDIKEIRISSKDGWDLKNIEVGDVIEINYDFINGQVLSIKILD